MNFRSFLVRLISMVAALSLIAGLVLAQPASAQDNGDDAEAAENEEPLAEPEPIVGDLELIEALQETGLLTAWINSSPVVGEASLVKITGSASYNARQEAFIAEVLSFTEHHQRVKARSDRLSIVESQLEELDAIALELRRELALFGDRSNLLLTEAQLATVRSAPVSEQFDTSKDVAEYSLDPVSRAEYNLATTASRLSTEVGELTADSFVLTTKHAEGAVARLSAIHQDLDAVRGFADRARILDQTAQSQINANREAAIRAMPALHQARLLNSTEIGGMTPVSIDAYIRAASSLESACPVDWALLGGIGRIESFHGTIGGRSVQVSGKVTSDILGPLLDGGATDRESDEAQRIADEEAAVIAAAEAKEQRILDELEFEASIWGLLRRLEIATELPEEYERFADSGEDADEEEADEQEIDDQDDDVDETGDEAEEVEEVEPQGNGFAVIVDTDNGALDGNTAWDRAVGPMQFLPETWSRWGTDGSRDGVADPQNLYDAAVSAGRFLCSLSRTRGSSPSSFILGYNSSTSYVRSVLNTAEGLRADGLPNIAELTS